MVYLYKFQKKSALDQHCIAVGHKIIFPFTVVLSISTGFGDTIIKLEIQLVSNTFIWDIRLQMSLAQKPTVGLIAS